jgi:hypothetical protein
LDRGVWQRRRVLGLFSSSGTSQTCQNNRIGMTDEDFMGYYYTNDLGDLKNVVES